jgi:hypothetical protein
MMGETLRYIVSIDSASGVVKVEQIGEAGDLTPVELDPFLQSLGAGTVPAGASSQIVINIYAGGAAGAPVRLSASGPPYMVEGYDAGPRPPHGKPGKPGKP